ncbi:hypothetical protein NDU88_001186 [Pleurodeles waltl]|uniref:Uncharacterized protein n=1 Tax=Pleurodeles waltl TaxID=8319 RepID=A0AAV7V8Y1_PLEWA|nr:hypothetical protein NDU88_001186 [Pleurodeles waltl]
MPPSRTATSASHCSIFFAVSRRPRLPLGPRPRPGVAALRRPTGRVFNRAPGPQPASPPQRGNSTSVPRRPRADRSSAASVHSPARGRNPYRGPAPVFSGGRPYPGAPPRLTPTGVPRCFGPSAHTPRWITAQREVAARPPALKLAEGPFPPPGTFQGRHGGPNTPGRFRRLDPSARTSIGPERVRFCTFSRRPLRSEKFRRAPSPGPWPRPLGLT